ncbi:hypothetical protein AB0N05_05610 [Nocardia sp. NPDC051030]|uniref:hypothetical protein n=1 Tax=Nocardia sp. NPDC051030 TaxID=3155162 RepID=UPI00341E8DBE
MVAVVLIALAELIFVFGPALALVIAFAVRGSARNAMAATAAGRASAARIPVPRGAHRR